MVYQMLEWNGYRKNRTSNSYTHLKFFYFNRLSVEILLIIMFRFMVRYFLRFKSQYLRSLNVFACNFLPFKIKLCRQVFRVGSIILMTHNSHRNPKFVSLPIIRTLILAIPKQLHWTLNIYIYIYTTNVGQDLVNT